MPSKFAPPKVSSHNEELGLERIVFFSDAVMAIALTLLVIDLRVPVIDPSLAAAQLPAALQALTPKIMSFVVSFAVVGIYWTSHHRYFGFIRRYDGGLIGLNLLFLLFIALMPFVASLLGQYGYLPQGVATYAAAVALTGLAISALWWYASHNHRLIDASLDDAFIHTRNMIALVVPLVFIASIPFAWVNPYLCMGLWWISPLLSLAIARLSERKRPKQRAVKHT